MSKKILLAEAVEESLCIGLVEAGFRLDKRVDASARELLALLPGYEGLIFRSKLKLEADILRRCPRLEFIARAGSGMEQVDTNTAKAQGIAVFGAAEANSDAVAEHTLGMLLALLNRLCAADADIRKGIWDREKHRGRALSGKHVGLIGYGHAGAALGWRLAALGARVWAYDPYRRGFGSERVQEASLEVLHKRVDVLSFHAPLTAETRHMGNKAFFERFEKPVYVLNTSRGGVLVLEDLLAALLKKQVQGAGLDVLENERLETLSEKEQRVLERLQSLPQVLFSPHVAGWSVESYQKISHVLLQKIKSFYQL